MSYIMKKYIIVDMGCLCCSMDSSLVGIFTDKIHADKLTEKLNKDKTAKWAGGGHHLFEVFETTEDNVINPFYVRYL